MWDVGLSLVVALMAQPQAATLERCEFLEERWVCRYRLPDIELLNDPSSPPLPLPAASPASRDPGVLTEAESELVGRCADAGWMSLCLPAHRREARRLRDAAAAYDSARTRVGVLISEGRCDEAVAHALTGGYLSLARESRGFCADAD